jgi:hypothetical protein
MKMASNKRIKDEAVSPPQNESDKKQDKRTVADLTE